MHSMTNPVSLFFFIVYRIFLFSLILCNTSHFSPDWSSESSSMLTYFTHIPVTNSVTQVEVCHQIFIEWRSRFQSVKPPELVDCLSCFLRLKSHIFKLRKCNGVDYALKFSLRSEVLNLFQCAWFTVCVVYVLYPTTVCRLTGQSVTLIDN